MIIRKDAMPTEPKRLSGGHPQIPKGDGDGPVQAYIAAVPGWNVEPDPERGIGVGE